MVFIGVPGTLVFEGYLVYESEIRERPIIPIG
jgi:hypothetical protein